MVDLVYFFLKIFLTNDLFYEFKERTKSIDKSHLTMKDGEELEKKEEKDEKKKEKVCFIIYIFFSFLF